MGKRFFPSVDLPMGVDLTMGVELVVGGEPKMGDEMTVGGEFMVGGGIDPGDFFTVQNQRILPRSRYLCAAECDFPAFGCHLNDGGV